MKGRLVDDFDVAGVVGDEEVEHGSAEVVGHRRGWMEDVGEIESAKTAQFLPESLIDFPDGARRLHG